MDFANHYRDKRILVTGHTGFKGAWLSEWLLSLGANVAGFSVDIPTQPSLFEVLGLADRLEHHFGDIRDLDSLREVFSTFRPEIVFHLAAQPLVRDSYDDPKTTFDTNVGGTVNVLEAIRETDSVRAAVMVTTDKCYENVEWEYGYREVDPLGGKDPYSASKAATEIACHSYSRSFFQDEGRRVHLATARAGNVIGGGDWAKDRIIPDCVRAWTKSEPVVVRNPGATRPWQHVLEPLGGYLLVGAYLDQGDSRVSGQAFNFGPNEDGVFSVEVLLKEMQKTWSDGVIQIDPSQTGHRREANLLKLNCDKALARMQWRPRWPFEKGIASTMSWYQSYYREDADMAELTRAQINDFMSS